MIKKIKLLYLTVVLLIVSGITVFGQTSAFTYQGRFTDSTVQQPTNGTYSMTFRLYDALSGGTQIGSPITTSVSVVNGIFAAQLDFGAAAFNTSGARYLEMQVGASTLTPRQEINSTPFSLRAINAATATSADSLSANCNLCVLNGQLATNSVSTSKIINSSVSELKIADEAVTSLKIANGTIVNADISTTAAIDGSKISGSGITNLNASNLASGTVADARLSTNVTVQGNTFNGANQLTRLDGSGRLPAVDGSQLTNLPGGSTTPFVVTSIPASSATYSLASYGNSATRAYIFSFGGGSGSGLTIILTLPPANSYPSGTRLQIGITDYITSAPTAVQYQRTGTTTDTLHGFNQGSGSAGPGFPGAFSTWITDGSSNWYKLA